MNQTRSCRTTAPPGDGGGDGGGRVRWQTIVLESVHAKVGAMHDINVDKIVGVAWSDGPIPNELQSVEITYKDGEKKKYAGDDLVWVVPQIKHHFPSGRPNLLSDTSRP